MSLLTLQPRRHRPLASSPPQPHAEPPSDSGEKAGFARLLAATLAFYAAMIVAPLLALVPLALLGLALGLVGALVGG